MYLSLSSYADDSSDQPHQDIFCAGSFLGWPQDFLHAGWKWEDRLKRDNIEYFHACECEGLYDQFDPVKRGLDLTQARALALSLRYDLIETLAHPNTGLGAICVSLIRKDFEEVLSKNKKAHKFFGTDPVKLVYKRLIRATIELLETDWPDLHKNIKISFTFDTHSKWREAEEEYEALKMSDDYCARRMLKVGHADDKDYPALQMADLIASEGRLKTVQFIKGSPQERHQFKQMAKNENIYFLGLWNKEHLLNELEDAESKGAV